MSVSEMCNRAHMVLNQIEKVKGHFIEMIEKLQQEQGGSS